MEFVKKNMVFVIVLAVTAIASAYLIYMDIKMHGEVAQSNAEVEKRRTEIDELNKKKPAPIQENLDMIKADADLLKDKSQELQRIFGKPYREALLEFAKVLGMKEMELLDKFKSHYNKDIRVIDRYEILESFLKDLSDEKRDVEAAKLAFKKAVQPHTVEPIAESNFRDILLHALGLPRTMTPTICKNYVSDMIEGMANPKQAQVPGAPTAEVIKRFTFDFQTRVPPQDEIVPIVRHMQVYEDIFSRMRQTGVTQLESMERLNLVHGDEVSKDYLKFSYRVKLNGEMQRIRDFINNLQDAYKENRVYVIRDLALQCMVDETGKARERSVAPADPRVSSSQKKGPGEQSGSEDSKKPADPTEDKDYGKVIIGDNKLVQAELELDYYIFIGDELKPRR